MELNVYSIIQGTVATEKANELLRLKGQLVLRVHPKANKAMIKQAVEQLFNIKVSDVRTSIRKGKTKHYKRIESVGSLTKRAFVTVKREYLQEASEQLAAVSSMQVEPNSGVSQ